MWYISTKGIITSQAMNNDKFRRFFEFRIKNILLSHKFLGTNRINCSIVILTVQQILLKRSISSKGHHQFLMDFIWIRNFNAFRAKSVLLIKSAIQYNNSKTDSVVARYGAHLHFITPRQHGYLRRCWSCGESFETLCKIWPV